MNSWATPDQRVLLSLAEPVIKVSQRHIQARPSDCEAGGLLLGTVHGSSLAVTEATVPTIWDKRLQYFFERMPFGHSSIAQARWLSSGGKVRYVGEWHTHPQDYPCPSGLDRTEWNKPCLSGWHTSTLPIVVWPCLAERHDPMCRHTGRDRWGRSDSRRYPILM